MTISRAESLSAPDNLLEIWIYPQTFLRWPPTEVMNVGWVTGFILITFTTRWWFQICSIFTLGKSSNLMSIFFRWVAQPSPTRYVFSRIFFKGDQATCLWAQELWNKRFVGHWARNCITLYLRKSIDIATLQINVLSFWMEITNSFVPPAFGSGWCSKAQVMNRWHDIILQDVANSTPPRNQVSEKTLRW